VSNDIKLIFTSNVFTNHSENTIKNMQFAYKEREKGRTLKSIGDDLGLSKERIRSMIEYIKREIRQGRIEIAHS
tara:strand:- start:1255 stop:1476 length:222 start_codon:yes stop_codon:yes gene_type:complete